MAMDTVMGKKNTKGLVDLHCHLLPGIDDGSPDLEHSLDLAQAAVADGITHALLTPHHLNGRYVNHRAAVEKATAAFAQALKRAQINLQVYPGQEVRLSGQVLEALAAGDLLTTDLDGHYLLVEFPSDEVPAYTKQMLFKLAQHGVTPVIVHPERNAELLRHPERLVDLLEQGCLTQLTASSYVGTFGKRIMKVTTQLIAAGQGAILASDAHALAGRDYEMRAAMAKLAQEFSPQLAERYQENACALLNGDPVQLAWRPIARQKKFWFF